MITLHFALMIFSFIHISMMAIYLKLFRVKVLEVSYGLGPVLCTIDRIKIKLLPLGGHVKALDSREPNFKESDKHRAYNHQPMPVQVFAPLSGCIVVLCLSLILLGKEGEEAFFSTFIQIIKGTFSPLSTAQLYIQEYLIFIQSNSLSYVVLIIFTKLAAINLLPLAPLNGGQALISLLKMGKPVVNWEENVQLVSLTLILNLSIVWLVAVIYYFFTH